METLHEGFGDSKYRPCPLLRKYVKAGWLGKKTGRGFYVLRIRGQSSMELKFTEEQIMMRKMVRDFAKTEIEPFIEKMEKGEFPREILKKMGSLA